MTAREDCLAGDPANCPLERRAEDPRWAEMTERMDSFDEALAANTVLTKQVKANTDNIVTIFESGRAFFRVMGMVGVVAKWMAKVAAAALLVWAVFRYGVVEVIREINEAVAGGGKR